MDDGPFRYCKTPMRLLDQEITFLFTVAAGPIVTTFHALVTLCDKRNGFASRIGYMVDLAFRIWMSMATMTGKCWLFGMWYGLMGLGMLELAVLGCKWATLRWK